MIINNRVQNGWKILKEQGDIEKMVKLSEELSAKKNSTIKKVSRITIGAGLRSGRMNENTFAVISEYYNDKKKKQDILVSKSKTALIIEDGN